MAIPKARVAMPRTANKGDVVLIKILIRHRMETGYRVDRRGRRIPRNIVTRLNVRYAGEDIFAMDLTQGVSANPYIRFYTSAVATGDVVFEWQDNTGHVEIFRRRLTVSP
ncbi:MAG: thiosulfate oxidation carrier complex protein SoxZ [Hyphomicrobiaceae bacterium]